MSIYFMQPVGGGPIKIGHSANVKSRQKQLEAHYGCELVLLATMRGGRAAEKMIHADFSHLRIGRTEQFRPAIELMAFIGRPLLVSANPDAVVAMSGPPRDLKFVRLDLPPDVHYMLRVVAAEAGMSMAAYARKTLEEHIRAESKRKGYL